MMTEKQWQDLAEEHELAFFRADVCLGSPQSFSLEEKKRICEEMDESTAKVDATLKADFESLSPEARGMLLDMLCASDPTSEAFWKELLLGRIPDSVGELSL